MCVMENLSPPALKMFHAIPSKIQKQTVAYNSHLFATYINSLLLQVHPLFAFLHPFINCNPTQTSLCVCFFFKIRQEVNELPALREMLPKHGGGSFYQTTMVSGHLFDFTKPLIFNKQHNTRLGQLWRYTTGKETLEVIHWNNTEFLCLYTVGFPKMKKVPGITFLNQTTSMINTWQQFCYFPQVSTQVCTSFIANLHIMLLQQNVHW